MGCVNHAFNELNSTMFKLNIVYTNATVYDTRAEIKKIRDKMSTARLYCYMRVFDI